MSYERLYKQAKYSVHYTSEITIEVGGVGRGGTNFNTLHIRIEVEDNRWEHI